MQCFCIYYQNDRGKHFSMRRTCRKPLEYHFCGFFPFMLKWKCEREKMWWVKRLTVGMNSYSNIFFHLTLPLTVSLIAPSTPPTSPSVFLHVLNHQNWRCHWVYSRSSTLLLLLFPYFTVIKLHGYMGYLLNPHKSFHSSAMPISSYWF